MTPGLGGKRPVCVTAVDQRGPEDDARLGGKRPDSRKPGSPKEAGLL